MCKLKTNKQKWIYLWYLFSWRIQQGLPHSAHLFIQDHWGSILLVFFSFFLNYLIDSHLPQPEILGYVIYNTNIIKKTTFFQSGQIYTYTEKTPWCTAATLIGLSGLSWTTNTWKNTKLKGSAEPNQHIVLWLYTSSSYNVRCQGRQMGFPSILKPIPLFFILISQRFIKNAI